MSEKCHAILHVILSCHAEASKLFLKIRGGRERRVEPHRHRTPQTVILTVFLFGFLLCVCRQPLTVRPLVREGRQCFVGIGSAKYHSKKGYAPFRFFVMMSRNLICKKKVKLIVQTPLGRRHYKKIEHFKNRMRGCIETETERKGGGGGNENKKGGGVESANICVRRHTKKNGHRSEREQGCRRD